MCKTDLTREIFNPLAKNPSPTARFGIFHTVREDENNPISLNLHFGKDIFFTFTYLQADINVHCLNLFRKYKK